jgi:hypothetical protein
MHPHVLLHDETGRVYKGGTAGSNFSTEPAGKPGIILFSPKSCGFNQMLDPQFNAGVIVNAVKR